MALVRPSFADNGNLAGLHDTGYNLLHPAFNLSDIHSLISHLHTRSVPATDASPPKSHERSMTAVRVYFPALMGGLQIIADQ